MAAQSEPCRAWPEEREASSASVKRFAFFLTFLGSGGETAWWEGGGGGERGERDGGREKGGGREGGKRG